MRLEQSLFDFQNMVSMYGAGGMNSDGYNSQRNSGGTVSCLASKVVSISTGCNVG